jgi:hypothetical protein
LLWVSEWSIARKVSAVSAETPKEQPFLDAATIFHGLQQHPSNEHENRRGMTIEKEKL